MSRIGKLAIDVPPGTDVAVTGRKIKAKGPMGQLSMKLPDALVARVQDKQLMIEPNASVAKAAQERQRLNDARGRKAMTFARALDPVARTLWGTCRANAANLVQGVATGFTKRLELVGVGYRAQMQGRDLKLALGFSHDIVYKAPEGISIKCVKPTEIHVGGADKQVVGQVAAEIRNYRRPEPYKGKGVHYQGAYVRRKEGKKK